MGRAPAVCLALLVATGLSGCGRRGPLELPAASPAATQTTGQQTRLLNDSDQPGLIQSPNQVVEQTAAAKQQALATKPPAPPINRSPEPRKNTFVLDPLL